jgi:hypothetical protein
MKHSVRFVWVESGHKTRVKTQKEIANFLDEGYKLFSMCHTSQTNAVCVCLVKELEEYEEDPNDEELQKIKEQERKEKKSVSGHIPFLLKQEY